MSVVTWNCPYEGPHIGFQFHEGNSEERNSDSNSNDGNYNSIPIPPGLGKANSNSIPIPELDLELARKSNSGAELTPTLVQIEFGIEVNFNQFKKLYDNDHLSPIEQNFL